MLPGSPGLLQEHTTPPAASVTRNSASLPGALGLDSPRYDPQGVVDPCCRSEASPCCGSGHVSLIAALCSCMTNRSPSSTPGRGCIQAETDNHRSQASMLYPVGTGCSEAAASWFTPDHHLQHDPACSYVMVHDLSCYNTINIPSKNSAFVVQGPCNLLLSSLTCE